MKTMLAIAALLVAGACFAGEPAKPPESAIVKMDAKVKAERIERVARDIKQKEEMLCVLTPEKIERIRKASVEFGPRNAEQALANKSEIEKTLPVRRMELRWLRGELTPAGVEKAAADAQATLDKAREAKQPTEALEKALAVAVMERSEVRRLEAAEKPKDPDL